MRARPSASAIPGRQRWCSSAGTHSLNVGVSLQVWLAMREFACPTHQEENTTTQRTTIAFAVSVALFSLVLGATTASSVLAADITLLGPVSFRAMFPELMTQFEKLSGHKVTVGYAPLGVITDRVIKGEANDVAIVSPAQNQELQKQCKLLADSRVDIAKVGFIVFVKKGAPRPDLNSVDALKRTLVHNRGTPRADRG